MLIDCTKTITVYLLDDSQVTFAAGDYSATDAGDSCYVRGNGVIGKSGSYKRDKYSGTINFRIIKELKFTEPVSAWQTTPLLIALSIVIALIVFFSTTNFKT